MSGCSEEEDRMAAKVAGLLKLLGVFGRNMEQQQREMDEADH